jgi:hypothetical protein
MTHPLRLVFTRAMPGSPAPRSQHTRPALLGWLLLLTALLLAGCASNQYTVDDGRKVDEKLLANLRTFGQGEQLLRPAIARSAALKDADCDKQWELPFALASSQGWSDDERVAWVRALAVDERLTVIAAQPDSPLRVGEHLIQVEGTGHRESTKLLDLLARSRDWGRPFSVTTDKGRQVRLTPFEVCRGYTRLAPPNAPEAQDYHWTLSVHPLEVVSIPVTPDEALWITLWTQGVSEEGGVRMKAYHYGTKVVGTLYNIFTIASGLKGVALAADAAMKVAQSAASSAATEVIKKQLIEQASSYAANKAREQVTSLAKQLTQQQVMNTLQAAAANRGSLGGVARIAATIFDRADLWAFQRLQQLKGDPMAPFTLHQKLLESGLAANSLLLDPERLAALDRKAKEQGFGDRVEAALRGVNPESIELALSAMPLASGSGAFSYEDATDPALINTPFARGLIDGMMDLPAESVVAQQ